LEERAASGVITIRVSHLSWWGGAKNKGGVRTSLRGLPERWGRGQYRWKPVGFVGGDNAEDK